MDPCVVCFSRTGNTKRLAQAIADAVNTPIMDISETLPSTIETFDPLMLGTPLEGYSPAKETAAFIERMNRREGGKSILFCTYRKFRKQSNYECHGKRVETQRLPDKSSKFQRKE
jgi:flavodoxin